MLGMAQRPVLEQREGTASPVSLSKYATLIANRAGRRTVNSDSGIHGSPFKKESEMRKTAVVFALALVVGLIVYAGEGNAQTGPGYGMGPGMMGWDTEWDG